MDQDSAIHRNSDIPIIEKESPEQTWLQRQWSEIFYTPKGVRLRHYTIVTWLGRIGFIAKGILYAFMGGLCIATAQHLTGDITGTESPMVCTHRYTSLFFFFLKKKRTHINTSIKVIYFIL